MYIYVCVCVCVREKREIKEKQRQTEDNRKMEVVRLFSLEKQKLRGATGKVYKITKDSSGGSYYTHCLNSKAR